MPPWPRFVAPPSDPPNAPPDDDDDDLMGPSPGPERYTTLLEPGPNTTDMVLISEGMDPPAPPPPPPPPPSMAQQAGNAFAQAAGDAAGGVIGSAAATAATAGVSSLMTRAAVAAGMGALGGAEGGPAGALAGAAVGAISSFIGSQVGGAVRRGFEPGGGSSQQPPGPAVGAGGLQARNQPRNQEAINRQQRLHNQGTGAPAAQVDFRTVNGMNDRVKPVDRKSRFGAANGVDSTRQGVLVGASSSSSGPMVIANSGTTRPAAPMDPGGAKIPRTADPAPSQAPSYKDLVGQLKAKAASTRPRSRSPSRGDRRPLDVQRKRTKDNASLFPGGDGREEAMARRSKKIPKDTPREFYIGEQGTKRKADTDLYERRKRPNPAAGNQKLTGQKRKATAQPDDPQASRRKAPKPEGRMEKTRYSRKELVDRKRGAR